jgi:hypothetical protein
MPQGPEQDTHVSQLMATSLKNGFASIHLLAVDCCGFQCGFLVNSSICTTYAVA